MVLAIRRSKYYVPKTAMLVTTSEGKLSKERNLERCRQMQHDILIEIAQEVVREEGPSGRREPVYAYVIR